MWTKLAEFILPILLLPRTFVRFVANNKPFKLSKFVCIASVQPWLHTFQKKLRAYDMPLCRISVHTTCSRCVSSYDHFNHRRLVKDNWFVWYIMFTWSLRPAIRMYEQFWQDTIVEVSYLYWSLHVRYERYFTTFKYLKYPLFYFFVSASRCGILC